MSIAPNASAGGGDVVVGILIVVPEPLGGQVRELRTTLGEDVAVPTHVTLVPPMPLAADALPAVVDHLSAVAAAERPFSLRLRGTDTFQPVTDVVYLRLDEGWSVCDRLQRRVRSGPLHVELRYPYHPHVTLAHDLSQAELDQARAAMSQVDVTFTVERFGLFVRDDDGWELKQEFPLAAE